jgi:cytochrome oxidase Cu insertion factor (SCO1/SenC/PrrC family)
VKVLRAFLQAIVLLSVSLVANFAMSQVAPRDKPIDIGDVAPNFTLEDQNKTQVTLADARQKSPVVLVFYRGYW